MVNPKNPLTLSPAVADNLACQGLDFLLCASPRSVSLWLRDVGVAFGVDLPYPLWPVTYRAKYQMLSTQYSLLAVGVDAACNLLCDSLLGAR
jgi:hypothetical protein